MRERKLAKQFIYICLMVLVSIVLAYIGSKTFIVYPRGFIQDDAYMYAKIAYNIGALNGSTFDGINVTSGYHLLWCWLLSGISFILFKLSVVNIEVHLIAMIAFQICISFGIAHFFGNSLFEKIILFLSTFLGSFLMETVLLAFVLLIFVYFMLNTKLDRIKYYFALTLIPLIRIDFVIVPFIISLYFLIHDKRKFFVMNLFALIGVGLHFSLMYLIFDNFFSVSSILKAEGVISPLQNFVGNLSGRDLPRTLSFFVLIITGLFAIYRTKVDLKARLFFIFLAISVYVLGQTITNAARAWYFYPAYIVFPYLICRTDSGVAKKLYLAVQIGLIAGYFAFKTQSIIKETKNHSYEYSKDFVEQVKQLVPEDEPIFQIDGAGYIGFYTQRHLINGDGIVNSYEFARLKNNGQLGNYLKDNNIKYFVINHENTRDPIIDYCGLILPAKDADLLAQSKSKELYVEYSLWKIRE